jgi:hypothetical protein
VHEIKTVPHPTQVASNEYAVYLNVQGYRGQNGRPTTRIPPTSVASTEPPTPSLRITTERSNSTTPRATAGARASRRAARVALDPLLSAMYRAPEELRGTWPIAA